jgi:hypothetical protein
LVNLIDHSARDAGGAETRHPRRGRRTAEGVVERNQRVTCWTRALFVTNRSSVASAGRPTTSQNVLNWPSLPTAITNGPSAAGSVS